VNRSIAALSLVVLVGCSSGEGGSIVAAKPTTTTSTTEAPTTTTIPLTVRAEECRDRMNVALTNSKALLNVPASAIVSESGPAAIAVKVQAEVDATRTIIENAHAACVEAMPECPDVTDELVDWMMANADLVEDSAEIMLGDTEHQTTPPGEMPTPDTCG
jgi:hypothetical protein